MTLPVFLLDIDGVLNAASKKPDRNVWPDGQWIQGRASIGKRESPILAARPVADFIRDVHEQGRAEIRWLTTWLHDAAAVGKLLDLPDFPVEGEQEWKTAHPSPDWWKIPAALRVVEDEKRPLVWADDDAGSTWNLARDTRDRILAAGQALIVCPSPTCGLSPKNLRLIDRFLTDHGEDGRTSAAGSR